MQAEQWRNKPSHTRECKIAQSQCMAQTIPIRIQIYSLWPPNPTSKDFFLWVPCSEECTYTRSQLAEQKLAAAAAAAKSLQSCPTLCDPRDSSPSGFPVPGILQARTLEWVAVLQSMKVKRESEVAQSCLTLSDPMDCSLPGSSIHGIFQARVLEWVAIAFSEQKLRNILKTT